jgi:hypothetical protein
MMKLLTNFKAIVCQNETLNFKKSIKYQENLILKHPLYIFSINLHCKFAFKQIFPLVEQNTETRRFCLFLVK